MQDQTLLLIILGVVTLAVTMQAVALVGAFMAVRRLEDRFTKAEAELRALQPRIEQLGRVIDNLSHWSDTAAEQLPRLAKHVEERISQVKEAAHLGAMVLVKPLRPIAAAIALWKGLKRGTATYRGLRPAKRGATSPWVSAYESESTR